jgi:phage FluMu gp28-like protein
MRTKITKENRILLATKLGINQKYQHDLIVDDSPRIIVNKSCSIGISYAAAFKKTLDLIEEPGTYKLWTSQRRENVSLISDYVRLHHAGLTQLLDGVPEIVADSKTEGITFANNSKFLSFPAEANAMRAFHGDVTLDEFAFMPDDMEIYKTSRSRLKPGKKQFIIISSPNEEGGKFYQLWKREFVEKFGRWKCYYLPYTVCKIPGFIEDIEEEKTEALEDGLLEDWEQEYKCKFINKASLIFNWDLIQGCLHRIGDKIQEHVPECKAEFGGMDFAQKIDKSVLRTVGKTDKIIVRENPLRMQGGYTEQLEGAKAHVRELELSKLYGDKTSIGRRLIEELEESDIGYLIEGITFTNEWKEQAIMYLYSLMTAGKIVFPDDRTLLEQIHKLKREKTVGNNWRYTHKKGQHDDEVWALCLALQGYIKNKEASNGDDIVISGKQNANTTRSRLNELRDQARRMQ